MTFQFSVQAIQFSEIMGTTISVKRKKLNPKDGVYHVSTRDTIIMKRIWKRVENDLLYHGVTFYTIFFKNHPQYLKYFHEDMLPEFVQDTKLQKRFSRICNITSALFIDSCHDSLQRDYLLNYISIIHKDMQLSLDDLENFAMDMVEMLIQEHPDQMIAENLSAHVKYFKSLTRRIMYFMKIHKEDDHRIERVHNESSKMNCQFLCNRKPRLIYGRSFEYWQAKKRYWETKVALWTKLSRSGISIGEENDKVQRVFSERKSSGNVRKLVNEGGTDKKSLSPSEPSSFQSVERSDEEEREQFRENLKSLNVTDIRSVGTSITNPMWKSPNDDTNYD